MLDINVNNTKIVFGDDNCDIFKDKELEKDINKKIKETKEKENK